MSDRPKPTPASGPDRPAEPRRTDDADAAPKRRVWWKRWSLGLLRLVTTLLVLGLVLGLLAVVAVTLVLRSDLPRSIAERVASGQLGLAVSIGALDVGWSGPTILRDLAVRPPLDPEPILTTPYVRADHPNLLVMGVHLLTGGLPAIDAVTVTRPQLDLRESPEGRWNVTRAVEAVVARQTEDAPGRGVPPLPAVAIGDASVRVTDRNGRFTDLTGVRVVGRPDGPLRYAFGVDLPGGGTIKDASGRVEAYPNRLRGEFVPGGDWRHAVAFALPDLSPYVAVLLTPTPMDVTLHGRWTGRLVDGELTGRLDLREAAAEGVAVNGVADVTASADALTAALRDLSADTGGRIPEPLPETILLRTGRLEASAEGLRLEAITLQPSTGGLIRIHSAAFDPTTQTAAADVEYRGLNPIGIDGIEAEGRLGIEYDRTDLRGHRLTATSENAARFPGGSATTMVRLDGSGEALSRLDWALTADAWRVNVEGRPPLDLPSVSARLRTVWEPNEQSIALLGLENDGEASFRGQGEYVRYRGFTSVDADGSERPVGGSEPIRDIGWLWADATGLPFDVPRVDDLRVPADVGIDLWVAPVRTDEIDAENRRVDGPLRATIKKVYAAAGGVSLEGSGSYSAADPQPLRLDLVVSRLPPIPGEPSLADLIRGEVYASAGVAGQVSPLALDVRAELHSDDLVLLDRYVFGDARVIVTGSATAEGGLDLQSETIRVLGGTARVSSVYPLGSANALQAVVLFDGIELEQIGAFTGIGPAVGGLGGTAGGRVGVKAMRFDLDSIEAAGRFVAWDVTSGLAPLADRVSGDVQLVRRRLTLEPLRIESGDGEARVRAEVDLAGPLVIAVAGRFEEFPLSPTGVPVSLVINGRTHGANDYRRSSMLIDFSGDSPRVEGGMSLGIEAEAFGLANVARVDLDISADGRVVRLDSLDFTSALGGALTARASYALDDPNDVRAEVTWAAIDLGLLPDTFDALAESLATLEGVASGQLRVAPSGRPDVLGPIRIDFGNTLAGGSFRGAEIGNTRVRAYATRTEGDPLRLDRLVTETFAQELAGGRVDPFIRVVRRPGRLESGSNVERGQDALVVLTTVRLRELDLGQLLRAVDPELALVAGRLAGEASLQSDLRTLLDALGPELLGVVSGTGRLQITDADLSGVEAIDVITEATDEQEQTRRRRRMSEEEQAEERRRRGEAGRGVLEFRVANNTLRVPTIELFIRGFEVRGDATVVDLTALPRSPIRGGVFAAARPLRDVRLPFFRDLDQALGAIQASVGITAFRIEGTADSPQLVPAPIAEFGDTLRGVVGSQ